MNNKQCVTVLVAEADPLNGKMIGKMLKDSGYTVAGVVTDGHAAIEMAENLQPDIILMDMALPKIDGVQATQLISLRYSTPVVAMAACDDPELVVAASKAGVSAYLLKSAGEREIDRTITCTLARFDEMMALRRLNARLMADCA